MSSTKSAERRMRDPFLESVHLTERACWAVDDFLAFGVREIDAKFGDGYAAKNPELLGAYIRAAAHCFDGLGGGEYDAAEMIAQAIGGLDLASPIVSISDSLDRIASAVNHFTRVYNGDDH